MILNTKAIAHDPTLSIYQAKEEFLSVLRDRFKDYHIKWSEAKKRLDLDSRFDVLESEDREEIFRVFQKKLKSEMKSKEKKKKKEKRERERKKREKMKKAMGENPLGLDVIDSNEEDHDRIENVKEDGDRSSEDKVEDISVSHSLIF